MAESKLAEITIKRFHQAFRGVPLDYHVYCSKCEGFGFCGTATEAGEAAGKHLAKEHSVDPIGVPDE